MKKKFLIYAPPYDPNTGGSIAMHKLCDLLNRAGREAFLYPLFPSFELHPYNLKKVPAIVDHFQALFNAAKNFKVNPDFITPVLSANLDDQAGDEHVVVYPELVFGNPLRAPHVVRWMMHRPGFHTKQVYFGFNELHFYFSKAFRQFDYPGNKTSDLLLAIRHYPYNVYLDQGTARERSGTAYCLRKGKGRPLQHDISDSVLIDGKSHEEIAEIFKRVKTFISYDLWTAYSRFAALAGCDSVVVPEPGMNKLEWTPEADRRAGIAYGFDDLHDARQSRDHLIELVKGTESESIETTQAFIAEVDAHFADKR
jgi:hypothetical protein